MAKHILAKKEKAKGFVGGKALYQQRARRLYPFSCGRPWSISPFSIRLWQMRWGCHLP
jgi:hypothetical protein